MRGPPDVSQWHHPVPRLAWLLQGLPELCMGDRGPARLPHQDHIRQVGISQSLPNYPTSVCLCVTL